MANKKEKANAKTQTKATDKAAKAADKTADKAEACFKSLKKIVPKKKVPYLRAALNHATDKNLEAIKKMPKKKPGTARFFAIFGFLGLDRFYLGDILRAITKILATLIIGLTVCARFLPYFKDEVKPQDEAIAPAAPETVQDGLDMSDYGSFIGVWVNETGETTIYVHENGVHAVTKDGETEEKMSFTCTPATEDSIKCLYIVPEGLTEIARMKLSIVSGSMKLEPAPVTPEPENPGPVNPGPETPDPETPDPENPNPETPDPENPNPEPENPNPEPENPNPEEGGGEGGEEENESVKYVVALEDGDEGEGEGEQGSTPAEGEGEQGGEEEPEAPKDPTKFIKQMKAGTGETKILRGGIPESLATYILIGVGVIFGLYIILDIFISPKKAKKQNYYNVLEIINPTPKDE